MAIVTVMLKLGRKTERISHGKSLATITRNNGKSCSETSSDDARSGLDVGVQELIAV